MSKKNKNNTYKKEDKNNKKDEKPYRNPARSRLGKIIIVTLALLMALSGLVSLIYIIATR